MRSARTAGGTVVLWIIDHEVCNSPSACILALVGRRTLFLRPGHGISTACRKAGAPSGTPTPPSSGCTPRGSPREAVRRAISRGRDAGQPSVAGVEVRIEGGEVRVHVGSLLFQRRRMAATFSRLASFKRAGLLRDRAGSTPPTRPLRHGCDQRQQAPSWSGSAGNVSWDPCIVGIRPCQGEPPVRRV